MYDERFPAAQTNSYNMFVYIVYTTVHFCTAHRFGSMDQL